MNTNTEEFVRLWTQNAQRIYSYLLLLVANRADADDLLQETSIVLWQKIDEYEPGTNFRAWACQIAFNKVRNFRHLRMQTELLMDDELLQLLRAHAVEDADLLDWQNAALDVCFNKLRKEDQQLIVLRYRTGATVKSIANEVGRSADAIYKALSRIHTALFNCIRRSPKAEADR